MKENLSMLTKYAVTKHGKHFENHMHCFLHKSDNAENNPLLVKYEVITYRDRTPLLFERGQ